MILDQRGDQQRHRARRGGNHAGPAAHDGGDHGNGEGRVQADLRIDAGDQRKRERFRNQGQGDHGACEQVATDIRQPFLAEGM
ncbi:hypothetical protein D3C81_1556890 [compost metagenome]